MRSINEIRNRLKSKNAVIVTASELKNRVVRGDDISDVDVVTCGTCGIMSGTYAVLSVPVASPGTFARADSVTIQGVPGIPGPCPNERLGLVDFMVFGTAYAHNRYGGGHLFRDLISRKPVDVEVTAGGKVYSAEIFLDDLPLARLFTTRSAFKNYTAITNEGSEPVQTIFSVLPLEGSGKQATVSGCGEINPLENDPCMRFLSPGAPVVMNGSVGRVIGTGTRSSPEKPNLSVHADMKEMDPQYCGGFVTSAGPECITSIGTAIPLVDDMTIRNLCIRDADIHMPVVDIATRQPFGMARYNEVWTNTASRITFHPERCLNCSPCNAIKSCPVQAIKDDRTISHHSCFVCGTCVQVCKGLAYKGHFGSLDVRGIKIPIVLRQSDRRRAEILCKKVKKLLIDGEFSI